ncbi:hypothetical protein J2TS6_00810 [Paenibacillus albilobatus]|uniref:Rrf2 family transcriptional regulator n=1 Tax=Paenibacillus albilobatus TaxID=2716884 RepID=A0A919XE44_9BACL|nr:hypothetical protein J2TS6_00810 [Paenibacillus albilobatus]
MKFPKATDYALHTMLFLTAATPQKPGVQQLAERQSVSPTYFVQNTDQVGEGGHD